jgi:hypothetical protein
MLVAQRILTARIWAGKIIAFMGSVEVIVKIPDVKEGSAIYRKSRWLYIFIIIGTV